jgi:hypothetical protein
VIRVFPAWPEHKDTRFQRLRTQGGFLVSSSLVAGKIDSVEVESTAGGPLRLVSPWKKMAGILSDFLCETRAHLPIDKATGKKIAYPVELLGRTRSRQAK